VSLFSRESICLGLERSGAALVRLSGGKSLKSERIREAPFTAGAELVPALVELLRSPPWQDVPLHVTFSDAWARYWITQRVDGLRDGRELDALAASEFAINFGDEENRAEDWQIRLDPDPNADAWLCCALPRRVIAALADACGDRLASVQPHFVRAWHRYRRRLSNGGLISLAGAEATTVGILVDGNWHDVRMYPPLSRGSTSAAVVNRFALLAGIDVGDAPEWPQVQIPRATRSAAALALAGTWS
jgi:hypothetical protein